MIFHCINSSPEPWESRRSERRGAAITCGSLCLSQHQGSLFVFHYFPEAQGSCTAAQRTSTHTLNYFFCIFPIFSLEDCTVTLQIKLTSSFLPCMNLFSLEVRLACTYRRPQSVNCVSENCFCHQPPPTLSLWTLPQPKKASPVTFCKSIVTRVVAGAITTGKTAGGI